MRLSIGYPSNPDELHLLTNLRQEHPINTIQPVVDGKDLLDCHKVIWDVHIDETVQQYIIDLVTATRTHPDLALGASPRASLALFKASQAFASLRGRDHVIPDDVKYLVPFAVAHRMLIKPESELRGKTTLAILSEIVDRIPIHLGKLSVR